MALTDGTNIGFVRTRPTADPAGSDQALDTTVRATKFVAHASAIQITEIGWYCGNATEAANYDVAIYSHDAGSNKPNTRIASLSTVTGLNNAKGLTAGWKYVQGLSIPVTGGTTYWAAVQLDDTATTTNIDYEVDASFKTDYRSAVTACPDTWGTSTGTSGDKLAIYVLYTYVDYNATTQALTYVYKATSGGTSFGSNIVASAAWDYFPDAPAANDAIYFGTAANYNYGANSQFSDLVFNVGTAMAGTDIVLKWEYYDGRTSSWIDMTEMDDDTTSFTTIGSNRVKFPLQYCHEYVTINGVAGVYWVRCRLHSFTTVTEGGANQTTAVSSFRGAIDVVNASPTAVFPATIKQVVDSFNAQYPYVTSCRYDTVNKNIYYFENVGIRFKSPVKSTGETIYFKCGSRMAAGSGDYYLQYFTGGELTSSGVGSKGTHIMVWDRSTWYWGSHSSYTYLYGCTFGMNLNATYPSTGCYITCDSSTMVDCIYNSITGYSGVFSVARSLTRVVFVTTGSGAQIVTGFAAQTFNNITFTGTSNQLVFLYDSGGNFDSCNFKPTTGYGILQHYQVVNNKDWYVRDPVNAFPAQTDNPFGVYIASGSAQDQPKAWFYDDSLGTYTDITTACNNATTNDVNFYSDDPLDYWYFGFTTSAQTGVHWDITCSNASNDNGYTWEAWVNSAWRTMTNSWDTTANFTVNGKFFPQIPTGGANAWYANTTVNGTSNCWWRVRCTTRGVANPTLSRIRWISMNGATAWNIYVQYSTIIKVVDQNGTAIPSATVVFTDALGTSTTKTTDASGLTTVAYFTVDRKQFDPTVAPLAQYYVKNTTYNPYTVTVYKSGYITKKTKMTLNSPAWTGVVALEPRRNVTGEISSN